MTQHDDLGQLEYSYTKGFRDSTIINFYIDHKLKTIARLNEGDRVTVIYDFTSARGLITRVDNNFPSIFEKKAKIPFRLAFCPKLFFSSNNKHGKLKAWFDMNSEIRNYHLLPFEIFQEQIPLTVVDAREGIIHFFTGKPKSVDQMLVDLYNNYMESGIPSKKEISELQSLVRELRDKMNSS